jgi:hypothetical protein
LKKKLNQLRITKQKLILKLLKKTKLAADVHNKAENQLEAAEKTKLAADPFVKADAELLKRN